MDCLTFSLAAILHCLQPKEQLFTLLQNIKNAMTQLVEEVKTEFCVLYAC